MSVALAGHRQYSYNRQYCLNPLVRPAVSKGLARKLINSTLARNESQPHKSPKIMFTVWKKLSLKDLWFRSYIRIRKTVYNGKGA